MPAEIVITSVPRGLDGGSGFQPVRRTKGMNPSLAERLMLRSGYSHPFRQGDGRNPVVYVHRIERVAGGTQHVIGRICDAGSDHTGRSNRLGHLLALESSAVAARKAGPAAVALKYEFEKKWSGAPEERDPPVIIGCTQADPAPCAAWVAAGLDPGIAGDLAEAAMKGQEVCLITPASEPDKEFVLRLFADALALVQPSERWKVTFNTCEIEPFDATWRAIRADLPQARAMRERGGRVIDLTAGARGSDGAYAAYARGEVKSLPWQGETRSPPPPPPPPPDGIDGIDGPGVGIAISLSPSAVSKRAAAGTKVGRLSAVRGLTAESAATYALVAGSGDTDNGSFRIDGATLVTAASFESSAKRTCTVRVRATLPDGVSQEQALEIRLRTGSTPPPGPRPGSTRPWLAVAVAAGLLILLVGTVAVVQPEWLGIAPPDDVPVAPPVDQIADGAGDDGTDRKRELEEEYAAKKRAKELKKQLESPADGRTVREIRADVEKLQAEIARVRAGPPALRIAKGETDDPDRLLEDARGKCESVQKAINDERATIKTLEAAENDRRDADGKVREAEARLESKRKTELAAIESESKKKMDNATRERQAEAYKALRSLATHAVLPSPRDDSLDGGSQGNAPIDLGPFPVADLIDPTFALAVPRDEVDGKPFVAQVRRPDATRPEWLIEFVPHAVEGELAGSKESSKPRPLAKLLVKDGRLSVSLTDGPTNNRRQSLLRRCVVLVSATRPSRGDATTGESPPAPRDPPREIRFVMPTKVGTVRVDPFGGSATLDVKPPPGISCAANGVTSILPTASCEVKAKFVSLEVSRRLPPAPGGDDTDRVIEERIPLAGLGEGADLVLDVAFSPREAHLRITPRVGGPNAGRFPPLEEIEERFCKDPEAKRETAKRAWTGKVMSNPGMRAGAPKGMNDRDLKKWFSTPLNMGIAVPAHETIEKSLDLFLKHEYREAEERLKQRREAGDKKVPDRPGEPASFQEWVRRDLLDDKDPDHWKQNFQDKVVRWWAWFVPQFDAEWNRLSGNAAAVLNAAKVSECRIESITSLAYDAAGHEYAVPLVEFGENPQPAPAGNADSDLK